MSGLVRGVRMGALQHPQTGIAPEPAAWGSPVHRRRAKRVAGLFLLAAALLLAIALSLAIGARPLPLDTVLATFLSPDANDSGQLVVRDLRLPRTLLGIVVGAALAVAGSIMQALTRNPLADPSLLGVNAGATLAVVGAIWLFHLHTPALLVWCAMAGAGIVGTVVYALATVGRGGATPVRLALAGAAVSAIVLAIVSAILILSQESFETYRFWITGSIAGGGAVGTLELAAFVAAGLILALMVSGPLNALGLGDDAAMALGTRIGLVRVGALAAVALLSGAAVAAAGPVGFIGLVVPHAARAWVGPDQRWLLGYSLLLGPIVLLVADTIGRIALPPGEVQVGIMMAILGGPLFIAIVRRIRLAQL